MELFAAIAKHAAAPDRRLGPPALWWRRHTRRAAPRRPGEYAGAGRARPGGERCGAQYDRPLVSRLIKIGGDGRLLRLCTSCGAQKLVTQRGKCGVTRQAQVPRRSFDML